MYDPRASEGAPHTTLHPVIVPFANTTCFVPHPYVLKVEHRLFVELLRALHAGVQYCCVAGMSPRRVRSSSRTLSCLAHRHHTPTVSNENGPNPVGPVSECEGGECVGRACPVDPVPCQVPPS